MKNGKWEPDPQDIQCTSVHVLVTPVATTLGLVSGKCGDPVELTNALALSYVDPALEGQIITYACSPGHGQMLNGSNRSICMENGKWEPDPQGVKCTGVHVLVAPVATTLGILSARHNDYSCFS